MMRKLLILGILFLTANPCWGEVSAWVENNPVVVGEMFRLHVEAKNVVDAEEPDLSGIHGLQVLNRSVQNQTSIVGTSISRTVSWTYVMLAPSSGNYLIPALRVGNELTSPISLKAVESSHNPQQEIVRLDVEVTPKIVYPQQQIRVRLRIIRTGVQLENESLTPFEPTGAQIEKLNQTSYQNVKNGKRQLITEISYVLLAEKSGTLVLPQVRYQGDEIRGGNSPRNFGNFGNLGNFGNFGNLFQKRGRRIFSTSDPQTIEVKPLPSGFKGWWLPAKNLEIEEKWQPNPPVFRVGEPLTRTLEIQADGVFGNQIPELRFELPETIKAYTDQALIETEKTTEGLKGKRTEKWALIPSQPGKIELPEIIVDWWDISRDEFRRTILPARIIDVLPALGSVPENSAPIETNPEKMETNQTKIVLSRESAQEAGKAFIWQALAFGFALLWGGTLFLWYFKNKNKTSTAKSNYDNIIQNQAFELKEATKKVEKALRSGGAETIQAALLKWGSSVWAENPPQGLEQIGERVPELKNGIKALNSVLYGKLQKNDSFEKLQQNFCELSISDKIHKNYKHSQLTPLYPDSK